MHNKKIIIANIILFLTFLVMFVCQWFVLKMQSKYFVLIYFCILCLLGLSFIVLAIFNIIGYLKKISKDFDDINAKTNLEQLEKIKNKFKNK